MEIVPLKTYDRIVTAPPDKSITHRAVLFNALCPGEAAVVNPLLGEDCLSTIDCMRRLGAEIEVGERIWIRGAKPRSADLYAGNSGTTMRLLMGALAGTGGTFTLDGDASLRSRPMERVSEPLSRMGASVGLTNGRAPVTVVGRALHGIEYTSRVASAQVKSAILLAGLRAEGATKVTEPLRSRDHTERMLAAMGAEIRVDGCSVTVSRSVLSPVDVTVCGDISAAAYALVLAACIPDGKVTVRNVGVNPTRDGILEVLRSCGAELTMERDDGACEPYADITLRHGPLKPFKIDGTIVPRLIDELPALAVLACFIEGESVISGAAELRVKESDRIETTVNNLRRLGADAEATADGMVIRGVGRLRGGASIDPALDHRSAMSMAVAMAASEAGGRIEHPEIAAVSYPRFYEEVIF